MKVGFTGSRLGMTSQQSHTLDKLFGELNVEEFHHGDCKGSDYQAHRLAMSKNIRTIVHPPNDSKYRAFCSGHVMMKDKPFLKRNKDIVNSSDLLIATPRIVERLRSGTWSTVRYAENTGKRIKIIDATGEIILR